MILVVGATGTVGGQICRRLVEENQHVRALVRASSDAETVDALKAAGIEIVPGDLRDGASLDAACRGVDAVITTASAMPFRYIPGENDIKTTDRDGMLRLIGAAVAAGVSHFVYTSFSGNLELASPLRDAKRTVEAALRASTLRYTILRPSCFQEAWLSPVVGFDYPNAKATIFGSGDRPVSYVASNDVAEFAVLSLTNPAAWNTALELGGPQAISQLEAMAIFERVGSRSFEVTHVPEEALVAQAQAASDPLQQTFPTLMRCVAQGDPIPMEETVARIPVKLTSVTEYAERVLGKVPATAG